MIAVQPEINYKEFLESRQQYGYWKKQHERAVKREAFLKEKAEYLERQVKKQKREIKEKDEQIDILLERVALLQKQVFGRRTERIVQREQGEEEKAENITVQENKRRRGKQKGAKGYGRKRRNNLPTEISVHEIAEEDLFCPICGKPCKDFPGTEDSEEIDWEVKIIRRIHKRKRYQPTCDCKVFPGIFAAPVAPKIIPKGMFSNDFLIRMLLEKFLFQRPLYRICKYLQMEGLEVSQGTLTGNLRRMGEVLQPLYAHILERSRAANHWHMDETRWKVFEEIEGKSGYRWWLWVVVTKDTCAYILDPSRSSEVPKIHLGEGAKGIINADRYSAYKSLGENIRVSFCWAHVRRDFLRIRDGNKRHRKWACEWIELINAVFHTNKERVKHTKGSVEFLEKDKELREEMNTIHQKWDEELQEEDISKARQKVLKSLRNHWSGLILFVEHPEIPMDNNEAERCLRNPVVGRKNYYGSGAVWSGVLSAMTFSIFQTLLLHNIHPLSFLSEYLLACAHTGGKPPDDMSPFLPWNISEEKKTEWGFPEFSNDKE